MFLSLFILPSVCDGNLTLRMPASCALITPPRSVAIQQRRATDCCGRISTDDSLPRYKFPHIHNLPSKSFSTLYNIAAGPSSSPSFSITIMNWSERFTFAPKPPKDDSLNSRLMRCRTSAELAWLREKIAWFAKQRRLLTSINFATAQVEATEAARRCSFPNNEAADEWKARITAHLTKIKDAEMEETLKKDELRELEQYDLRQEKGRLREEMEKRLAREKERMDGDRARRNSRDRCLSNVLRRVRSAMESLERDRPPSHKATPMPQQPPLNFQYRYSRPPPPPRPAPVPAPGYSRVPPPNSNALPRRPCPPGSQPRSYRKPPPSYPAFSRTQSTAKERAAKQVISAWAAYESRWERLATDSRVALGFHDIPWPTITKASNLSNLTTDQIGRLILSSCHSPSKSTKERLRNAMLTWHPDKFEGRWIQRVREEEKENVRDGVKSVMRCLNELVVKARNQQGSFRME
jgi:hypothetical protein